MKIDRLIGIIAILLQVERTTAPELAERFEVSRRTIVRDIDDLCRAGIPIVTTQGYGGGISIMQGYKIDRTILTETELRAVLAGIRGLDSVSETPLRAGLSDKLAGVGHHIAADESVIIDLASHYQDSLTSKIELMWEAIGAQRIISFRYYRAVGTEQRRIEPYHVVFAWSSWYVLGFCLAQQTFRLFKLNRLWDLQMEEGSFVAREVPSEALSFGDFLSDAAFHLEAVFDAREEHRLVDEYGPDSFTVRADGRLGFERDFANYDHMKEWVFSFGDAVDIVAPQRLRDERREQAAHILGMDSASDES